MTDKAALLIPLEGEPEVLMHPAWRPSDVAAALGVEHVRIFTVPAMPALWKRELLMYCASQMHSHATNPAARLLNPHAVGAEGSLLILALGGGFRRLGLDEADLAGLATLLAIGELKRLEN